MKIVTNQILQPVRDHYQKPVIVSSGYRSPLLNARIGGSGTSHHCLGQAVDFELPGLPNKEVAQSIGQNLDFDQLILEFYDGKNPNSGWIHCSYVEQNRNQSLAYNGSKYELWT